jgi:hypothetical protein
MGQSDPQIVLCLTGSQNRLARDLMGLKVLWLAKTAASFVGQEMRRKMRRIVAAGRGLVMLHAREIPRAHLSPHIG